MATNLPVGSIVTSILNLHDFQSHVGPGEVWELADGHAVSPAHALSNIILHGGSDYAILNPGNTPTKPNLNGVFLRGRDTGGNTEKGNPDGNKPVGTWQRDDIVSHNHDMERPDHVDGQSPGGGQGWFGTRARGTGYWGGSETRPRNVTVNFYIRVN